MTYYTKDALKEAIQQKLRLNYGCTEKQATDGEIMKACALALRDAFEYDVAESTRAAEARRSEAMTGAPLSVSTPEMTAVPLSTLMSAPMRLSSEQCMKRCGKIVSFTTEMPGVVAKRAVIWACMSVG